MSPRHRPPCTTTEDVERSFWYRTARLVMRRAIPIGVAVTAFLLALGAPFLGVRWGYPDDRVLPASSSARVVSDRIRAEFRTNSETRVKIVLPTHPACQPRTWTTTPCNCPLSAMCAAVSSPAGTFSAGELRGPPSAPAGMAAGSAYLTVDSTAPLYTRASEAQLARLRADRYAGTPAGTNHGRGTNES